MWPYYIVFLAIFVISFIPTQANNKYRFVSCWIMFLLLSLFMGLRHESYAGVDTEVYVRDFNRIVNDKITFGQISTEYNKDYLYYYASKLFSVFCSDANMWLLFCSAFYIGIVSWFIYKYSKSIWLSYLIFVGWDMYAYNFQLVRHTLSLAFILLAFPYLLERKKIKYGLVMFCAIMSQVVSTISIVSYLATKLKPKVVALSIPVIIILLMSIIFSQREFLISLLFSFDFFSSSERFSIFQDREGGQLANFSINLLFLILSYYEINKNSYFLSQDETNKELIYNLFIISIIGLVFYSLQFVIGEFYRVAQYFSIFNIILIPHVLSLEKNSFPRIIITWGIAFFLVRHFFGGIIGSVFYDPYRFYWE